MQRLGFIQFCGCHTLSPDRASAVSTNVGELGQWDPGRERCSLPMSSLLGGIKQVLVIHAVCLWQPEQPVGTGSLLVHWYMLAGVLGWREVEKGGARRQQPASIRLPAPCPLLSRTLIEARGKWPSLSSDQSQFVSLKQFEKIHLSRPEKSRNLASTRQSGALTLFRKKRLSLGFIPCC